MCSTENEPASNIVLKILRATTAEAEARMVREIGAVARLRCAYVPPVRDSGRRRIGNDDRNFIVECFMSGETYRDRLCANRFSRSVMFNFADVLLRACCDFETAQLVHRDIKPENLIIGVDGKIWIIDFGIVRMLDLESLTSTAGGSFTPGYGAPEQMRNLKPKIDSRTDLFSVGIVLYESLAGMHPYRAGAADQLEIIRRVENQDLPTLVVGEDASGALAAFIASLASRFPSRRPQTSLQALEWFVDIRSRLTG